MCRLAPKTSVFEAFLHVILRVCSMAEELDFGEYRSPSNAYDYGNTPLVCYARRNSFELPFTRSRIS